MCTSVNATFFSDYQLYHILIRMAKNLPHCETDFGVYRSAQLRQNADITISVRRAGYKYLEYFLQTFYLRLLLGYFSKIVRFSHTIFENSTFLKISSVKYFDFF
jgi:hypothetical protein